MKVVICQNCGEKYQLNDNEDVNSYECNVCAGNLEEITKNKQIENINTNKDSEVVYCHDCGLKYCIDTNDNINDYECDSCGGELKYINDEKNIKLTQTAKIPKHSKISDLKNELENIKQEQKKNNAIYQNYNQKTKKSYITDNNYELTIYKYYNELKQELKREYLQHILNVPYEGGMFDQISHRFKDKIKSNNVNLSYPELNNDNLINDNKANDSLISKYVDNLTKKEISIILGTLVTIIGLISILIINIEHSILILILGIILLVYGFYNPKDNDEEDKKNKHIIRSKLLTLPEDYYVLYYVKTPGTNIGINHVVIGPTGIFTIITQKNNPNSLNMNKNDLKSTFNSFENYLENKYDLNSTKDSELRFNDELDLKQRTLTLNRILFRFLDENGFTIPIEPMIGFVSDDVAIINDILNDDDLFMDEFINKITKNEHKLDSLTIRKCAILLSHYSINCPN